MYEDDFKIRLTELRTKKGVSARDMSLSIGQNPGYINSIECGKSLPSMTGFFYICEYLGVSPKDFFDYQISNPEKLTKLNSVLNSLSDENLELLTALASALDK